MSPIDFGGSGGLSEAAVQAIADTAEDNATAYADTAISTLAAADVMAVPMRSATLHCLSGHGGLTTGTPSNRRINISAFRPARACTLSKVAVEQTTAGEAGSTIRLAIFEDTDGFPLNVLWQSPTTIAGDGANGEKSQDPDLAVVPTKLYYAALVCQSAVTTRPTFRYIQTAAPNMRQFTSTFTSASRVGFAYDLANDSAISSPLSAGSMVPGGLPFPAFWLQAD